MEILKKEKEQLELDMENRNNMMQSKDVNSNKESQPRSNNGSNNGFNLNGNGVPTVRIFSNGGSGKNVNDSKPKSLSSKKAKVGMNGMCDNFSKNQAETEKSYKFMKSQN